MRSGVGLAMSEARRRSLQGTVTRGRTAHVTPKASFSACREKMASQVSQASHLRARGVWTEEDANDLRFYFALEAFGGVTSNFLAQVQVIAGLRRRTGESDDTMVECIDACRRWERIGASLAALPACHMAVLEAAFGGQDETMSEDRCLYGDELAGVLASTRSNGAARVRTAQKRLTAAKIQYALRRARN